MCSHQVGSDNQIISIFNGSDVQIENSITRVTVWHHEACRAVITSNRIFSLDQAAIMVSFFCILILRQLLLGLNMCYFINFYAQITTFSDQEMFGSVPI